MAKWKVNPIEVKAYTITNVSEMTDDGGRDITIDYSGDGKTQLRHATQQNLALYEPENGDYWVEYETVAMPWNKREFEKRHHKLEEANETEA